MSLDIHVTYHAKPNPSGKDFGATGSVQLLFANRQVQQLALATRVLHPEVRLSHGNIDFRRVHIASSRSARVYLENPTDVEAHWKLNMSVPHDTE